MVDTVRHTVLLDALDTLEVRWIACSLFRNYLQTHKQIAQINEVYSAKGILTCGVLHTRNCFRSGALHNLSRQLV